MEVILPARVDACHIVSLFVVTFGNDTSLQAKQFSMDRASSGMDRQHRRQGDEINPQTGG